MFLVRAVRVLEQTTSGEEEGKSPRPLTNFSTHCVAREQFVMHRQRVRKSVPIFAVQDFKLVVMGKRVNAYHTGAG